MTQQRFILVALALLSIGGLAAWRTAANAASGTANAQPQNQNEPVAAKDDVYVCYVRSDSETGATMGEVRFVDIGDTTFIVGKFLENGEHDPLWGDETWINADEVSAMYVYSMENYMDLVAERGVGGGANGRNGGGGPPDTGL